MPYDDSNIFAKILRNEIPSHRIFESDHALAILDAFPCTAGHALLIPKYPVQHVEDLAKENDAALGTVMKDLGRLSGMVRKAACADATNIIVNNGVAAGQAVPHLHFHVIPRKSGDGLILHPKPMGKVEEGFARALLARME